MDPFPHIRIRQLSFEKDNEVRLWKPFVVIGLGKMAILKSLIGSFYLLVLSYVLLNIAF